MALPLLILAMAIVTALGRSLDNIMKSLIIVGWPIYARTVRGSILTIREEDFVRAVIRSTGAYIPEERMSNDEFTKFIDTSDE